MHKNSRVKSDNDLISVSLGKVADDPTVLEFGVFEDGRMTAAVGCGIDAAHGFRLNNSAVIRFAPGAEREELYRPVFMGVTDMLLGMGLVPFDDIQNGEYALRHGGCLWTLRSGIRYGTLAFVVNGCIRPAEGRDEGNTRLRQVGKGISEKRGTSAITLQHDRTKSIEKLFGQTGSRSRTENSIFLKTFRWMHGLSGEFIGHPV